MQGISVRAAILAAGAAVTLSSAQAAVFTATWTGAGGTTSYSDPANWSIPGNPGAIPVNDVTDQFNVIIPASAMVELDIATPNTIGVQDFTLGAGAKLSVRPGRAYTVLDDAQISGTIEANGISSFTAVTPGSMITGTTAKFLASGAATISVAATTQNVQNTGSATVYSADGASTSLNLSGLSAYNWLSDFGGAQTQQFIATNGAAIDLSALESINVTAEAGDRLLITQTGGGAIDLSSLTTISGATEVRFVTDAAAFTLPSLANANNVTYALNPGSTLDLPELVVQTAGRFDVPAGGAINLPKLTSLTNSAITIGAGTFSAPVLADIDNTQVAVTAGGSLALADATYNTNFQFGGTKVQLSAEGAGSMLDLSEMTTYQVNAQFGGAQVQQISATNGGTIDLSGLTSIAVNAEAQDRVEIAATSGGTIDLSALQTIAGDSEVRFISDAASLTLPALASTNNATYALGPGSTLNLPALVTQTAGRFDVPVGGTVNLPVLTSLTNAAVTMSTGTFAAPALVDIDNTQIAVTAGGSLAFADGTYNTNFQFGGTRAQFSADGAGSVIDLSATTAYAVNGQFGGTQVQQIRATNGAQIDLSGLTSITLNAETQDRLEVIATSGGVVDLSALQTIAGDSEVRFTTDVANFTLPALANANNVTYAMNPGSTLNLPALVAQTAGRFDVPAGGTVNLPVLTSLTNATVTLASGTFSTPVLANIDNTQVAVTAGGAFASIDDTYNTNFQFSGTKVQLSADGVGSSLDLSATTAYLVNGQFGGTQVQQVKATNDAHIDLSGLTSIAVNADTTDRLEFFAQSGASIDLTALQSITGNSATRFTASGGGTINLGDLTVSENVQFVVSDITSTIDFAGSLIMHSGTASFATGSTLAIGNHFSQSLTDETDFVASSAILQMSSPSLRAAGEQFLEVAGLDVGNMNPGNNGNFGFGQLVVGADGGPATRVTLLDVVDNGNRGGSGDPEALYLFGLGGPEGLIINTGSTLLINNINVYFFDDGEWVHLNSLFGPDEYVIPFDNGFVELPAPGALPMLGLALIAGTRRRR